MFTIVDPAKLYVVPTKRCRCSFCKTPFNLTEKHVRIYLTEKHVRTYVGQNYRNICVKCMIEAIMQLPNWQEQLDRAMAELFEQSLASLKGA